MAGGLGVQEAVDHDDFAPIAGGLGVQDHGADHEAFDHGADLRGLRERGMAQRWAVTAAKSAGHGLSGQLHSCERGMAQKWAVTAFDGLSGQLHLRRDGQSQPQAFSA